MSKLLAYHGEIKIRDKYHKRMLDHIEADELIQRIAYEDGKGCFVGCTLNKYDHKAFENELGFPEEIAQLSDAIFERLNLEDSKQFAKDWHNIFTDEEIEKGIDLTMVWPKFSLALLSDKQHGVLRFVEDKKFEQQKKAINQVAGLYEEWIQTQLKPEVSRWDAARDAARAAGAAAGAARAARAAGDAAWAARAAGDAAWKWMRDKLFELFREAS